MEEISKIAEGIRSLEIQGARNVAIAGLRALRILVKNAEVDNRSELLGRMSETARELSLIRVTEPGLRNVLASVIHATKKQGDLGLDQSRIHAEGKIDDMLEVLDSNLAKIREHGADVIEDGATVFTHCHSSSVTSLIISESKHKEVSVICTETRPRWQGRKTARELADNGVDTTLFVDSATHMYLSEADLVLIGADSVGGGRLYNKIGSYMVISFAKDLGIPSYSVCETQKFDPLVAIGYVQPVEQRASSEVIEGNVPFKVRNPAFETVPIDMFNGIITEQGIVAPPDVDEVMRRYEHLIPELKGLVEWDDWEE